MQRPTTGLDLKKLYYCKDRIIWSRNYIKNGRFEITTLSLRFKAEKRSEKWKRVRVLTAGRACGGSGLTLHTYQYWLIWSTYIHTKPRLNTRQRTDCMDKSTTNLQYKLYTRFNSPRDEHPSPKPNTAIDGVPHLTHPNHIHRLE